MSNEPFKIPSFTIIVSFVCLSLIGLALLPLIPVRESTSAVLSGLSVNYSMPGASPLTVEKETTVKLERMLARINGVKCMRSVSSNGNGTINLEFNRDTDMGMARLDVSSAIRQVWPEISAMTSYPQIVMRQSDVKAMESFIRYSICANAPLRDMLKYAEDSIVVKVGQIKGVRSVKIQGSVNNEYLIRYDNKQLEEIGISVDDIRTAISSACARSLLGVFPADNMDGERQWMRVVLRSESDTLNLSETTVRAVSGKIIPITSLAQVTRIETEPEQSYRINGLKTIFVDIIAEDDANQLTVGDKVIDCMDKISSNLPSGYEMHIEENTPQTIRDELSNIYLRTALTVLILLVFIFIIARNMRLIVVLCASLAVNIAIALCFYYMLGIEIQFNSLAGITISLNLIIDNIIVMSDNIIHRHNMRVFMPMLAATLTTIGALSVIFFLDDRARLNLQDFAAVIIINLAVSLIVAEFFVPSTLYRMSVAKKRSSYSIANLRRKQKFTTAYSRMISGLGRHRVVVFVILVLALVLPVILIPDKEDNSNFMGLLYNDTEDETRKDINISATMPNGSTMDMMETSLARMESFLSGFKEIKQFTTIISSPRKATINIKFDKEISQTGFPHVLFQEIVQQAIIIGGGSWTVSGAGEDIFSNGVSTKAGSHKAALYGYNYHTLMDYANELRDSLLLYPRVKDVTLGTHDIYEIEDYDEYYLTLDNTALSRNGVSISQVHHALAPLFSKDGSLLRVVTGSEGYNIRFVSSQTQTFDRWALMNMPIHINDKILKLSDIATIEKKQTPQDIYKENQQYCIFLQFTYSGSENLGEDKLNQLIKSLKSRMSMGYSIENKSYMHWGFGSESRQYMLIVLVIIIVFVISSILLNSLIQPFAIILTVPVSFIGVFLVFRLTGLAFGDGGFASLVLLCGITVNACIYLINEYNNIRASRPNLTKARAFAKAWNNKIIPIILTILSTNIGFVPFIIYSDKGSFWHSLSIGTISGLAISFLGLFVFLPAFIVTEKRKMRMKIFDILKRT